MRALRLLFLSFVFAALAQAETRVFVSLAGTLLEAEITAVAGDNVTLKRVNDGQTLVVNRRTLCKEDNAYIASWAAESPDKSAPPAAPKTSAPAAAVPKYSLACQALPSKSTRGPADGGPRSIEISYNFHISNREVTRDLQGAKGLVLTLAKDAAESSGDLVALQKEEFDVEIRAQSKLVHTTQPVQLTYDQTSIPRTGVKNYGYVLVIRDAEGNILFTDASPDGGQKYIKEILAITEAPCVIDRDFKPQPKATVPLGYIQF